MKKFLLFLVFAFSLCFGQSSNLPMKNADFSAFLMNYETPFHGTISNAETVIKLRIEKVQNNSGRPEQYFVSGYSEVEEGNRTNFSGEIIFTQKYNVKDLPDEMLVFGDFVLKELNSGEHSGVFTGKIRIQSPKVITKTSRAGVTCRGKWKNYSGNLDYDVWWANFVPKDISKVVFK
ncbi:hypothetical protein [Flavobacterium sp. B17]|uniref:hypothetical protein n=1 Tax=Flavobacterium sp. B17 TaxID=95618 RepID=UPI0003491741|nr:hypothetical protein [Flavobacterium sp. B17]